MSITITVDHTVSEDDFEEVETLARHLQGSDYNFNGRAIWVIRGSLTDVTDSQDPLRGALLMLMVDGLLKRLRIPSK
ncbi:hypothetical protein [Acidovorax sp. ACV01]|uniref:hypothetical protein n=1 Tax=Acidovorax sp. ACV01 TaxID=2769311 RepID=UPI001785CC6B|nr:hypothetical protein [Acidovorax sp. ACV01]MBD9390969.1 hypothetical protein [Acidovorax sp. ACV01]